MEQDQEDFKNRDVDLNSEESESEDEEDQQKDESLETEESEEEEENSQEELDSDKTEQEYETRLNELENLINSNKFDYQSFINIIELTKQKGEFNKLREYRQKMSQIFPLTENLWLDWLKDEQKYIDNEKDRKKVDELFQKAVEDYLSVDIWLEYIQFSIGGMGEENGIENVRLICEKAVSLAGLHVTKGYTLWEVYREFESALLAGYQQSIAGSIQSTEQTKQINEQIERILKIFKSQLSVVLDNTESTYKELIQFDESKSNDSQIKELYLNTLEKYKKIEPYEAALLNETEPSKKLEQYNKYLDFEIKELNYFELKYSNQHKVKTINSNNKEVNTEQLKQARLRIKCLFERALADDSNCLDLNLWLKYVYYLNEEESKEQSFRESNLNIFYRSTRNCTWSAKLWINYALQAEKLNKSSENIKNIYKEAMSSGLQTSDDYLQLWHSYLDFLRRHLLTNYESESAQKREEIAEEIRDNFQKAINQLFDYFKLAGDPSFSLENYWARVEAKYFKSMDKARKIFNEMILAKSDIGEVSSEIWLEFYQLEIQFGDEKHQRKLLNRALNELKNENEKQIILEILLKYEKLNGNVSQFSSVFNKSEAFKYKIQIEYSKKPEAESKKIQKEEKPKQANKKPIDKQNLKRKKTETETTDQKQLKDKDGFAIPSLPATIELPSSKKLKTVEPVQTIEYKMPEKLDSNCTVFISNLKYDVDEAKLKKLFEKEPGFKQLRLIKHWTGKTKGYGYVDFEKPEQAEAVLKLDRSSIDGRPVFISRNEDKSLDFGQNKFKYAINLEKNKLFVSGLPFTTDKPALEDIFKAFGKLKEIRIVTYKSGKSKGLAYVEFEDEQSASKALIQTDGMLIGENQITVAISNPPRRKQPIEESKTEKSEEPIQKSLGSGSIKSRTEPTTVASFVPRAQQLMSRKKTLNLK